MKSLKSLFWAVALILIVGILGYLIGGYYKKHTTKIENPVVTMEVQNFGTIKLELYPDIAPEAVNNFITLAQNGYYNGLTFHRVVKDFMIQGGDKAGDGSGSPTFEDLYNQEGENATYKYANGEEAKKTDSYSITGEFTANGYTKNNLNLTEGTLAMARADYTNYSSTLVKESYNSAGSQFFIITNNDHTNLSGFYAGFGKVIEGMDVVKQIENVECKSQTESTEEKTEESTENENAEISKPVEDVVMSSVTVDTKGVDYGMPKTLKPFNYMKWLYSLYGLQYSE